MVLKANGTVEKIVENDPNIPEIEYNITRYTITIVFVWQYFNVYSIESLLTLAKGSKIDVFGIINTVGPPANLVSKAGADCTKRDISIVDRSSKVVVLSLWGNSALRN